MATPITLPTSSGAITGAGQSLVNVRGFAARSGAGACSINIREKGSTGAIALPIYLGALQMAGDVWNAPLVLHGPLYCEIVSGTPDTALIYID